MTDDIRLYLLTGALHLLNDLRDKNSTVDSIDRAGQENALYRDRITQGRFAHFSVSAKKGLEKELISAIMNISNDLRSNKKRPKQVLLMSRRKRFKK